MNEQYWQPPRARRRPWVVLLVAAVLLPIGAFMMQTGQCVDMVAGAGESSCTSGPSIGWPGAWLLAAAGAITLVFSVVRLVRLSRQQRSRISAGSDVGTAASGERA